ncbi:hypothetical protein TWF694_011069 [Orbilia ellipsospora]|uniref:Terpene synthase n=1 Tax=Orbilia ellipsospora TaxID=2528407 RepID=A0AAV9X7X9_9PEZI
MKLIPALITPEHSKLVPEEYLKGYFSSLEPRIACNSLEELRVVGDMYNEWLTRGGCARTPFGIEGFGGIMALTMPEADPKKLIDICPLSAFAFLEDDFYDGDLLAPNIDNSDPNLEHLEKKYRNILNQLKSKLFIELLETDEAQNRYVSAYEEWAKSSVEDDNLQVEFESLEEYMSQRLTNVSASCFWNMTPIVHDYKLGAKEISDLDCIDQLTYRMIILINDLYSIEREWSTHAALGKPGLPFSAGFIIMRTQDVSVAEAKAIIIKNFQEMEKDWLPLRDKLVAECDPSSLL